MFELLFLLTSGQCVPGHATEHMALINGEHQVLVGETVELENNAPHITVEHVQNQRNSNCGQEKPHMVVYNYGDEVPVVHGNAQALINDTIRQYSTPKSQILFVELGTTDAARPSYDLQDFIFVVEDKRPVKPVIAD